MRIASLTLAVIGLVGGASAAAPAPAAAPANPPETAGTPASLIHRIRVDARGPLALCEVTRALVPTRTEGGGGEVVLDLALPERSALVAVEVQEQGRWRAVDSATPAYAADLYRSESAARGVTPADEPFDESAVVRLRLARASGARATAPVTVRYRFSAAPSFSKGRHRLRFPAAPERLPTPADVTVDTRDAAEIEIAGVRFKPGSAAGRASTRSGWEIAWMPRDPGPADEPTLQGLLTVAPQPRADAALGYEVRARPGRGAGPPSSVLFVVDRSRSVGMPGLSAERDLARRLLESLPPDTRFDVLFFDRGTKRLFPMSRPATRESIETFEAEMVAARMHNGTDLAVALRDAGALLRRESTAFGPRTLLALITDGALPDKQDGAALDRALGRLPGLDLMIAAFAVRPADDEPMAPHARLALQQLAGARGGVMRELRIDQIGEAVPAALADLELGGDLTGIRLAAEGRERALAGALPPGAAIAGVASVSSRSARTFQLGATVRGRQLATTLVAAPIPATWLRPWLASSGAAGRARATPRLWVSPGLVALVEPVVHVGNTPEPVVKGSMDRLVMRNVLSLAYMPRARACYLGRSGATRALRDLTGRVRLALDVVRGEVERATIESSTLDQPEVEACLREGAFAIDVPRAWRSDAAVTAILNMNFKPLTPEKRAPDLGEAGDQIDLLIEEAQRQAATAPAAKPATAPAAKLPMAPLPPR